MFGSLFVVGALTTIFWSGQPVAAQTSDVVCMPTFDWAKNSRGQIPCIVGAYLQGVCNGGEWSTNAINPGTHYIGPNNQTQNACTCSTVAYNLVSACGACQNRTWITYSAWTGGCTNFTGTPQGVFPESIPPGTVVPHWAYTLPSSTNDLFDPNVAKAIGDAPESTAISVASTSASSTTSSTSTSSTSSSASQSATHKSGGSSNAGPIAGGVVGGVALIAIIAGIIFFFVRRGRRQPEYQAPPTSDYTSTHTGTTYPSSAGQPPMTNYNQSGAGYPTTFNNKVYDPNDPTTFPQYPGSVTSPTVVGSSMYGGAHDMHGSPARQPGYSGVPEL